jgi:hypothetical protein
MFAFQFKNFFKQLNVLDLISAYRKVVALHSGTSRPNGSSQMILKMSLMQGKELILLPWCGVFKLIDSATARKAPPLHSSAP